jgi:4-hydroxy-4-methyl-2-oxoglutarate aldolase
MPEIPPSLGSWESLRSRLSKVDTCALCDGSGKAARVVDTVKPLRPRKGTKMVGRAHTVALFPGDFLMNLVALEAAAKDDVLMIDAGFRRDGPSPAEWPLSGGMFGELLAAEAERKGLAGMVIDGNCRDTPMTATFSIPIYSRGTHPNAGTAVKLGSTGQPVQMADVIVNHGDVVLGDDDGVVVCSLEELEQWLPAAEEIISAESGMLRRIRQGESLIGMTSYYSHVEALKAGQADSKLGFI